MPEQDVLNQAPETARQCLQGNPVRIGNTGFHHDRRGQVILQIGADTRQVLLDGYAHGL